MIVDNIPGPQTVSLVSSCRCGSCRVVASYALRERSEQAEAAEMRASLAEREREAAEMRAILAERERAATARSQSPRSGADRARAARHRRARDEHDGPPGRRRPSQAAASAAEDREALDASSKQPTALGEMRHLLEACAMRSTRRARPQPGLDALDSLVDDVTRAGLPVRLEVLGEAVPLPRAIDLSAYRIVQEG